MNVVILADGAEMYLVERAAAGSKAMAPIGEQPILWHLLQYSRHYGCTEQIVALGHRADSIQAYFAADGFTTVQTGVELDG